MPSYEQSSPATTDPNLISRVPIELLSERQFSNYGYIIERPTDFIINQLQQEDSRIEVIHGTEEVEGHSIIQDYGAPGLNSDGWYSLYIEKAIGDRLDQDFAGEGTLPIRSVHVSLDGAVVDDSFRIGDIREILRRGDIVDREAVNLAGYKPGTEGFMRIHHRVMQYAAITDSLRKVVLSDMEDAKRVFPALLAYDRSMLRPDKSGVYAWQLPESVEDKASVIRKAYILDAAIKIS